MVTQVDRLILLPCSLASMHIYGEAPSGGAVSSPKPAHTQAGSRDMEYKVHIS